MAITVTFDEVYGIAFRFGIWFGIGIFFSILFSTFRPQNPDFYAPKTKDQIVKELPPSFLSWVSSMTSISETRNVEMIGQDAVMFLKFMQLGQNLFMKLSVIAIPLILVNYYAPVIMNTPEETKTIPALTLLTMANIKKGSGLFYLHTVYTYLTTFMVFYAMVQIWNFYVPMRQEYLNSTEYTDNECFKTILFTQVPVEMRNGEAIQQYCDKYGITVTSSHVKIGKHLESLRKLIQCHSDKVSQFENVLVHHFKGTKPKPLHRLYEYQSEIQTIETKIKEARLQGYESFENAPYVLISFDTVASAHYAVQCLEPGPITVLLCRRPNDLVWKNLEIEPPHRTKRSTIAIVINVSLYIFWFCFVWFIGTFKKPSRLRLIWPQLETILLNDTILRIFIESYLGPVCVIITNFILLPRIMTKVSDLQLAPSATDIGHSSLRKFYTFLFYQRVLEVLMPLGESFFLNLRGSPAQAIQLAWASFSTVFVAVFMID